MIIHQILTPYPKTGMRADLITRNLVTNPADFKRYNGLWANVRTRHLSSDRLQYLFWYHRQVTLGWWTPSGRTKGQGRGWTFIWDWLFKPILKRRYDRMLKKEGWEGRYRREVARWEKMNYFQDLEKP